MRQREQEGKDGGLRSLGKKEGYVKTADERQQERLELSGGGRKEGSKGGGKDS